MDLVAPDEEMDFLQARPGDHLFCPSECELCAFYQLKGRVPIHGDNADDLFLKYAKRGNPDAFWFRRPGTIRGLTRMFFQQVEVGDIFGCEMFDPIGPFPHDYDSGMRSAIGVLWQSQKPGRHEAKQK